MPRYLTHDDGRPDSPGGADEPYTVTAADPRAAATTHVARVRKRLGPDMGGWGDGGVVTVLGDGAPAGGWRFRLRARVEFDLVQEA